MCTCAHVSACACVRVSACALHRDPDGGAATKRIRLRKNRKKREENEDDDAQFRACVRAYVRVGMGASRLWDLYTSWSIVQRESSQKLVRFAFLAPSQPQTSTPTSLHRLKPPNARRTHTHTQKAVTERSHTRARATQDTHIYAACNLSLRAKLQTRACDAAGTVTPQPHPPPCCRRASSALLPWRRRGAAAGDGASSLAMGRGEKRGREREKAFLANIK